MSSAVNGERHAKICETRFTKPYAVETRFVGKSLLTLIIEVLYIMDWPIRARLRVSGTKLRLA